MIAVMSWFPPGFYWPTGMESRVPPIGLDWFSKWLETGTAGKYCESPPQETETRQWINDGIGKALDYH